MSKVHFCWLLSLIVLVPFMTFGQPAAAAPLSDAPLFGDITFSTGFDDTSYTPVNPGVHFDSDTITIHASLPYENVIIGTLYKGAWYYNGEAFTEREGTFGSTSGVMENHITTTDGLPMPEGRFEFAFIVDGEVASVAGCTVGELPGPAPTDVITGGQPAFSPVTFAVDVTDDGELVDPRTTFPAGTTAVWAYFTYENMQDGMSWGEAWLENGEDFHIDLQRVWEDGSDGWIALQITNEPLPLAGEYDLILYVKGHPVQSGTFTVEMTVPSDLPTSVPTPQPSSEGTPGVRSGGSETEPGATLEPGPAPTFGPMHFTTEFDDAAGRPTGSVKALKPGIDSFYIYADWEGAEPGTEVLIWVLYGNPLLDDDQLIYLNMGTLHDSSGTLWHEIYNVVDEITLLPGLYMVAVSGEGEDIAGGQIMISPDIEAAEEFHSSRPVPMGEPVSPEPQPIEPVSTPGIPGLEFGPIHVTTKFDARNMRPVGSTSEIESGTPHFYVYAEFTSAEPGRLFVTSGRYLDPALDEWDQIYYHTDYRGEAEGLWWEQIQDMEAGELRPGRYKVLVRVDDHTVGKVEVPVSSDMTDVPAEPALTEPAAAPTRRTLAESDFQVGPVQFSDTFDRDTYELGPLATNFPAGTGEVYARFSYEGLPTGWMQWSTTTVSSPELGNDVFVYDESNEYYSEDGTWIDAISMHNARTLPPGEYEIEFSLWTSEGFEVVQVGTFTVGGTGEPAASAGPSFGPITFCEDVTEDGKPINATNHFPAGTTSVTALFTYEGMDDGMSWGQLWMKDGEVYDDDTNAVWDEGLGGWTAYYIEEDDGSPLSGEFILTLFIEGAPAQQGSFRVDPPAPVK